MRRRLLWSITESTESTLGTISGSSSLFYSLRSLAWREGPRAVCAYSTQQRERKHWEIYMLGIQIELDSWLADVLSIGDQLIFSLYFFFHFFLFFLVSLFYSILFNLFFFFPSCLFIYLYCSYICIHIHIYLFSWLFACDRESVVPLYHLWNYTIVCFYKETHTSACLGIIIRCVLKSDSWANIQLSSQCMRLCCCPLSSNLIICLLHVCIYITCIHNIFWFTNGVHVHSETYVTVYWYSMVIMYRSINHMVTLWFIYISFRHTNK